MQAVGGSRESNSIPTEKEVIKLKKITFGDGSGTTTVWESFKEYCKIWCPNETLDKQISGYIRRYPITKGYTQYLKERAEKEGLY